MNKIDEYLEHWGILGMHWGIRRSNSASTKVSTSKKKPEEPVVVVGKKTKTNRMPANHLSDQDLKDRIARISLEGNYANLTKTSMQKAKAAVGKMIIGAISTQANALLASYIKETMVPELMKRVAKATAKSVAT